MEAVIIKNIANSQLRIGSDTGTSKAIVIARDSEYMFKSPFEYGQFVRAVAQYEALRKTEVKRISGKKASSLYESNIQSIMHTSTEQDLQLDSGTVIEVKETKKNIEKTGKEDTLRKEIRQMKEVLKDTKDLNDQKRIKEKLKSLQAELKDEIKAQAK